MEAPVPSTTVKITKLDAAHSQLRTAIKLWFNDDDPVSIHMLAFAAYEVIHRLSKKLNPQRPALIFDSRHVDEEHRSYVNIAFKKHAGFFKHANRETETEIEFDPEISIYFMLYAAIGREFCNVPPSEEESAFLWWIQIHDPGLVTQEGREALAKLISVEQLANIRKIGKRDFLQAMRDAGRLGKRLRVYAGLENS